MIYHPNHVRLSDIALDQAPETANLLTQLPSPLFDIGSDFSNEYMNWEELWPTPGSSDAALNTLDVLQYSGYLDSDSPAQNHEIADLNLFETLSEDVQDLLPSCSEIHGVAQASKRTKRLQLFRQWLLDHASRPYPTRAEKAELAVASELSEDQVEVCLRNLRAREKHCELIQSNHD